jgi:hypothetical protein
MASSAAPQRAGFAALSQNGGGRSFPDGAEPQKVKPLVRVCPLPIGILAIDDLRLLRMQFQSTLLPPCRYFDTHQLRFPLCSAMDDTVIRVPLEWQMGPIAPHPEIDRGIQVPSELVPQPSNKPRF